MVIWSNTLDAYALLSESKMLSPACTCPVLGCLELAADSQRGVRSNSENGFKMDHPDIIPATDGSECRYRSAATQRQVSNEGLECDYTTRHWVKQMPLA